MLRMADGPVANLPPGMDAYAGYVNKSGIGITYPDIIIKFPNAQHLSITTNGSIAQCADVEPGAMSSWTGYDYGYCAVSDVNTLIAQYGRPKKLWTAHYDPNLGAHICSPACWPGLTTTADGTQWTDHNGAYDESLLSDTFFDIQPPSTEQEETQMVRYQEGGQDHVVVYQANRSRTVHYWQATPGTAPPNAPADFYEWHSEVLPEPA
jgi:hypothetical protein